MNQRQDSEAGFTLIEALVAMAVLALGAVSLLSAAEGHTKRITDLTARVAARWVADDTLTQLRLGLEPDGRSVTMYGIEFDAEWDRTETTDPDLEQLTVKVSDSDSGQSLYLLDGYVEVRATQ